MGDVSPRSARVSRRPAAGATRVSVRLLGRVELEVDGRPVRLPGRQAQALAALLVLVRRARARDAIAADLWPESASSATGSLRQALWLLRSSLTTAGVAPELLLEADADALGLQPDLELDVDVDRFDRALTADPVDAEAAIAEYRGELAECLGHECFARERERLADAFEDALVVVGERRLAARDVRGAREAALRLVARDPLREEAHATLIRAYGAEGSRSQVLRQYRRLRELLDRELGVEPLPETDAAFEAAMRDAEARSARAIVHEAGHEAPVVPITYRRAPDESLIAGAG